MRGEELPKWLFSLLFSLSGQGRDSVWLFMSMWVSKKGCGETHQPPFFSEGWAEVPVIGLSLSNTQTFSHSHSIGNPSRGCKDRGEDSVARQILENEARSAQ